MSKDERASRTCSRPASSSRSRGLDPELRARERLLRTIIATEPECVKVVSPEGELREMNPAGLAMLEAETLEQAQAQALISFIAPEYRAAFDALHQRVMQGERMQLEFELIGLEGTRRWLHTNAAPLRDESGAIVAHLAVTRDITGRKQAELRIRQLNRVYAMLSGINKTIVHARNLDELFDRACRVAVEQGEFVLAWIGLADEHGTPTLRAHAGATAETVKILGSMLSDPELGCAFTARALSGGQPAICNDIANDPLAAPWRALALDRGYRAMISLPLRVDGRIAGLFNLYAPTAQFFTEEELRLLDELALDVSFAMEVGRREEERLRAEAELRRSEERFRTLIEAASDLITVVNQKGCIIYQSPSAQRLLGHAPGEMTGRHASTFVHADDLAAVGAAFERALAEPTAPLTVECRMRHKDGSWRRMHSIARSLPEEAPEGFTVVNSRDVTERYALEEQLVHAQKMQAIGTLAGGVAHDFNNILLAILGNAELARMAVSEEHAALDSIHEILRAGARAKDLVQRILTFSRPHEHELRAIRLEPVLEEAARLLRSTLPAGIELAVHCVQNVPQVRADASQMHQIVLNLATNAWHALGERSGYIRIQLEPCEIDSRLRQRHPGLLAGPHLRLSVEDDGPGMTPEIVSRIFEPFFTTKPPGQGSGLGLAVVHGIVRNHGGAIVVDSEPGRGSTFHIYLPATRAAVEEQAAPPAAQPPQGNGEHILYIDDEEALVYLARRFLERYGYRVTGHTRPHEAIEAFRADPGGFDLVITDLNMPGSSGMEVAQALLGIRPDAPVVLASGYVQQAQIEQARALGIRDVILKPNTVEELAPAVQRLLADQREIAAEPASSAKLKGHAGQKSTNSVAE